MWKQDYTRLTPQTISVERTDTMNQLRDGTGGVLTSILGRQVGGVIGKMRKRAESYRIC